MIHFSAWVYRAAISRVLYLSLSQDAMMDDGVDTTFQSPQIIILLHFSVIDN